MTIWAFPSLPPVEESHWRLLLILLAASFMAKEASLSSSSSSSPPPSRRPGHCPAIAPRRPPPLVKRRPLRLKNQKPLFSRLFLARSFTIATLSLQRVPDPTHPKPTYISALPCPLNIGNLSYFPRFYPPSSGAHAAGPHSFLPVMAQLDSGNIAFYSGKSAFVATPSRPHISTSSRTFSTQIFWGGTFGHPISLDLFPPFCRPHAAGLEFLFVRRFCLWNINVKRTFWKDFSFIWTLRLDAFCCNAFPPTLNRCGKRVLNGHFPLKINARWWASPNRARSRVPHKVPELIWILYSLSKWKKKRLWNDY